jgi:hypothetical protein
VLTEGSQWVPALSQPALIRPKPLHSIRYSARYNSCQCVINAIFSYQVILQAGSCIATGYELDSLNSIPGGGPEIILFSIASRPALGLTQPSPQWVPRAFFLGVKRPGSEANYSPPSITEAKNCGAIPVLSRTPKSSKFAA